MAGDPGLGAVESAGQVGARVMVRIASGRFFRRPAHAEIAVGQRANGLSAPFPLRLIAGETPAPGPGRRTRSAGRTVLGVRRGWHIPFGNIAVDGRCRRLRQSPCRGRVTVDGGTADRKRSADRVARNETDLGRSRALSTWPALREATNPCFPGVEREFLLAAFENGPKHPAGDFPPRTAA